MDAPDTSPGRFPVVALGASAGGLKAFEEFFRALPTDTGMAFVLVQHLAPDQASSLAEILQRFTALSVTQVTETVQLEPNQVYVIPPNKGLEVKQGRLHLHPRSTERQPPASIDTLFRSLALDCQSYAVAIVLSGSGSDGAQGLVEVHKRGGFTMAQDPEEAEFSSMPKLAIETGRVDMVLTAGELASCLVEGQRHSQQSRLQDGLSSQGSEERDKQESDSEQEFDYGAITEKLHELTGTDFSHYKRPTMLRRLKRRIDANHLESLDAYEAYLSDHPEEAECLVEDLLIKVTEFFRDPDAFASLEKNFIPKLVDTCNAQTPIRVWVAGCATGQEAYSIAILLHEEFTRRNVLCDFKIFATDLDKRAIETARRGVFSAQDCASLSSERLQRFFTKDEGYRIRPLIRDRILFAVHDILRDPPFASVNLVSCRNVLIYLDPNAQRRAFEVLHYALKHGGTLFIGQSEFVGMARDLFAPGDELHRIYQSRHTTKRISARSTWLSGGVQRESRKPLDFTLGHGGRESFEWGPVHHAALSRDYAPPSLLVNRQSSILHVMGDVRPYLLVPEGKPTTNVINSVHPGLRVKLRTALTVAFGQNATTTTGPLTFDDEGQSRTVRVVVRSIEAGAYGEEGIALISFETWDNEPVSSTKWASNPVDTSNQTDLDRLEDELETVRRELEARIDGQEIITEKLTTANEELLTINEELQSTTEELETSQEELQSTNEELTTVNLELHHKVNELNSVNSDLRNLLSSTNIGTIFLDPPLRIKRFTAPVTDVFNILDSDIGRPLEHITHNLDYSELIDDARNILETRVPIEREITSRDGRWFIARAAPYKTIQEEVDGVVLTFFETTERRIAQNKLRESELLFRTVFESASDAVFVFATGQDGLFTALENVNAGASRQLGYSASELMERTLEDFIDPTSVELDAFLATLRQEGVASSQMKFIANDARSHEVELTARKLEIAGNSKVVVVARNIAAQQAYEDGLLAAKLESDRLAETRATFLANMSHEIRTPLTSIIGVSQLLGECDLSEKEQTMVGLIQTSGRRLHQTLDSVLDISRIEAGEMEPRYGATQIVKEIVEDIEVLRPLAKRKGIALRFHHKLDEGLIFHTDVGFIHRIVNNLIQNAIKFTDAGEVEVKLEALEGDALRVTVRDTGIGIDEKFLPHIFEKFKQASVGNQRRYDGSGLGLALVKHLVDILGGTIVIQSAKNEGTTFVVSIPQHQIDEAPRGQN